MSVALAVRQPSPTSPTRIASGTVASVKNTSLNPEAPAMLRIGRTSTPGWCMSMMNAVRPLCFGASGSVRASSRPKRALCAIDVQIFEPFTIHSSPSRTALGREPGDVGSRAGFAEQLAPDLLGGEDRAQEPLLLLARAAGDDRRAAHADAHRVADPRVATAGALERLVDDLLQLRRRRRGRRVPPGSPCAPGRRRTARRGTWSRRRRRARRAACRRVAHVGVGDLTHRLLAHQA